MSKKRKRVLNDADLVGINVTKPVVKVAHATLKRCSESPYRSLCPVCKRGLLFVRRAMDTMELLANDNCLLCGQHIEYTDIDTLKRREHG